MAARYWVGLAGTWDGTAGLKWSTTSGGVGGAAVPTSTDDVFLDGSIVSGNVTLASGYAANCKSLNCTGYVSTFASADATGSLTVAGAITFVAGMTLSITNTMSATVTATLTSGGKTFAGILILGGIGIQTHTLGDNWAVSGTLRFSGNASEIVNGNTFNVSGSLQVNTNAGILVTGTTTITMNGTGTWSHSTSGWLCLNLTFNTAGTITVSGNVYIVNNTLTYTAGPIVWTGSTLNTSGGVSGNTTVLNLSGQTINNYLYSGSGTSIVTLSANLTVAGNYTVTGNGSCTMNGNSLYLGGNMSINTNAGISALGTTTYVINGTGTWSHSSAGYLTNNLTINPAGTFTVSGSVIKNGGTILYTAGTTVWTGSTLNISAATTLTLGSQQPFNLSLGGSTTTTLSANLTITGTLATLASGSNTATINGFTIYVGGSLTLNASNALAGTTNIEMNGTGTWTCANSSCTVSNNLTFNTLGGTITISGNVYKAGTSSLIWTAGTMVYTSSTINIASTTTQTVNLSGQTVNNFSIIGGNCTYTISNNFTVGGTFLVSYVASANTTINGSIISCQGSFTINAPSAVNVGGTTNFTLTGIGTWSHSTTCVLTSSLTINTTSTITISGNVYKGGAATSITYTAGTVVTTGSTLNISADITLNTNGMSWNNISPTGTRTLTLNSLLTATGTWTCVATTTFAGTAGATIGTFNLTTAGVIVTFKATKTYTFTTSMSCIGTSASHTKFMSDSGGSQAILILNSGATQTNIYHDGTDINSDGGQTIWTVGATLSNTNNWNLGTQPAQTSFLFVF